MKLRDLLRWRGILARAAWSCEYDYLEWDVTDVSLALHGDEVRLKCTIELPGLRYVLRLVERLRGPDRLELNGAVRDADHRVAVKTGLWPPRLKLTVKSTASGGRRRGKRPTLKLTGRLGLGALRNKGAGTA